MAMFTRKARMVSFKLNSEEQKPEAEKIVELGGGMMSNDGSNTDDPGSISELESLRVRKTPSTRVRELRTQLHNEFSAYAPTFNRTIIIQRREGEFLDNSSKEAYANNLNDFLKMRLKRRSTEKFNFGGVELTLAELVDEVEKNRKKLSFPFLVISPYSNFRRAWSVIIFLLLFYTVLLFPLRLAFFDNDQEWFYTDLTIDCLFMADIFINFFSAFEAESGIIIYKHKEIARVYMQFWFWIDLISTFPMYMILEGGVPDIRGLQIIEDYLLKLKLDQYIFLIIKFSATLCFLLHFTGCGWYIIGTLNEDDDYDNWVRYYGSDSIFENYILSVHYICTVLLQMGSGPVLSTNVNELVFTSVLMFFGIAFYGEIMGSLSSCFSKLNEKKTIEMEREDFYKEFSKANKLPSELLQKILTSNKSFFYEPQNNLLVRFNKNNILMDFPSYLQHEIIMAVFRKFIKKVDFLIDKPAAFIQKVLKGLRPINVEVGNQVYKKFEPSVGVYFLIKGKVAMISSDNPAAALFYFEGSYFGELDILFKRTRTETAYAETNLEVWALSKGDFIQILDEFPDVAIEIKKIAAERENNRNSYNINTEGNSNFKSIVCQIEKDDYDIFHSLLQKQGSLPNPITLEKSQSRRRETFLRASAPKKSITELVGKDFEKMKKKKHNVKEYLEKDLQNAAKINLSRFFTNCSRLELNEDSIDYILNFGEIIAKMHGKILAETESRNDEEIEQELEEVYLKALRLENHTKVMQEAVESLIGSK